VKIEFDIPAFAEAARIVRQVPPSSMQIDILDHARMEVAAGRLTLTMSDGDIEACVGIDVAASDPVLVAVPRAVLDFIALRADGGDTTGSMEFREEAGTIREVTARAGRARITMPVLPGNDFPVLADIDPQWSFNIRAHEFADPLRRLERAMLPKAPHIWMDGAYLHKSASPSLIGTDGNRLHLIEIDGLEIDGSLPRHPSQPADGMPGVVIPSRAVKEYLRIFGDDESDVHITGSARMIAFSGDSIRLASKLIDAAFFDYRRMMKPQPEARTMVSAEHLTRAVRSLLVVPKTEAKGKKATVRAVTLTIGSDEIRMVARGDVGDSEETVEAETIGMEGQSITVNARYLTDAIDALGCATIAIHPPDEIGKPFHVSGRDGVTIAIGQRAP
jgi:DNA polymerase-3 subunit beta